MNNSYDKMISEYMQHSEFVREYIIALVENKDDPLEIKEALCYAIKHIGVTQFSKLIKENTSNVAQFLKGSRNPKESTLNKYLAPFDLKIKKILEPLNYTIPRN